MTHELGICLWFDNQAKEAALFYKTVFNEVEIIADNPVAVTFRLYGLRFMNLNGGAGFPINQSISFFVNADSLEELDAIWEKLSEGGNILMPLNKYPWSEKYGWCSDRFGVNWQLMLGHESSAKIIPSMMFSQDNNGKAAEAINFYTSIFSASSIISISKYEKEDADTEGNLKYAQFLLNNTPFCAMDSSMPHAFTFNEGVSFIVTVDSQEEIDHYWSSLSEGGQPGRCGWLKDKYGVSWQIVPTILGKLMSNPETAPKTTQAFLKMSKFVIADL
jgi:predicted 3-demethylubiquinone-9 3-methyltransferase (glyoxalase superfamily)